jgi:predicted nucleic acid-binding Zn ribbon protein
MHDEPKVMCDNCKVERIKLMGFGAVQFKGGGWGSSR